MSLRVMEARRGAWRELLDLDLDPATPLLWALPGLGLRPGAREALEAWPLSPAASFVRALPYPDLSLGASGAWYRSQDLPPFGPAGPGLLPLAGLLWSAGEWAALAPAFAEAERAGTWPCLPRQLLEGKGRPLRVLPEPWLYASGLPHLEALCVEWEQRGKAWQAQGRPQRDDIPVGVAPAWPEAAAWRQLAEAIERLPTGPLQSLTAGGHNALDLSAALGQAACGQALAAAFAQGAAAPPRGVPAVAKPLRRVAVVHPAYGGSLNLARRSAEALERLGFDVQRVDPSARAEEVAAAHRDPAKAQALFAQLERECLTQLSSGRPQWALILAQAPLSPKALASLRRQGVLSAFWFCEDFRVRPAWQAIAPAVDAFFPMQGGAFRSALRSAGAALLPVLQACAARDACLDWASTDGLETMELSFFGAPYRNRLKGLEALADLPLQLFGEGWGSAAGPALRDKVRASHRLSEEEGFEVFRRSAININLHSSPSCDGVDPDGDYVNPRTFEIAACGAFQLCDHRRDLSAAFEPGLELEVFRSIAELRAQVERFRQDPAGRRRRALASRRRVLQQHTYEHRMLTLLEALGIPVPSLGSATSLV